MVYSQQKAHLNHGCLWRCKKRANSGWLGLRHIFAILMMKSFRITIPNEKPWFHMDFFRSSDHISAGVCCPNAPCTSMYIHVRYLFIRRTRIILLVVVFCPMTSPSVPHFVYHIPWWNPSFWLQPPQYAQIDVVGCLLPDIPMYPRKLVIQTHHSDGFVWEFVFPYELAICEIYRYTSIYPIFRQIYCPRHLLSGPSSRATWDVPRDLGRGSFLPRRRWGFWGADSHRGARLLLVTWLRWVPFLSSDWKGNPYQWGR